MLHLVQKLDRGRWKTVAIAADGTAGRERLKRAVEVAPTARFRLIAMVDGVEQLISQAEPRLVDLFPVEPAVVPPPKPSRPVMMPPRPAARADDPFIPPPPTQVPVQVPVDGAAPMTVPSPGGRLNPLRLLLQAGGALIVLLVLIDNVAAVSHRMQSGDAAVPAMLPLPQPPALPLAAVEPLPPSLITAADPVAAAIAPEPAELSALPQSAAAELAARPDPADADRADPIPLAPAPSPSPPAPLPVAPCRDLAQAQARFGSRLDPAGAVQADPGRVEGADLLFRNAFGDWRPIRYRCHPAPAGGVQLVEIRPLPR